MPLSVREAHILMGPDGVGKSTMTERLAELLGGTFIDTGALLRAYNAQEGDAILQQAFSSRGLASEDLVRRLVVEEIDHPNNNGKDLCFCGIPRTLEQAKWLIAILEQRQIRIAGWYFLTAEEKICLERTKNRPGRETVSPEEQLESIDRYNRMMTQVYNHVGEPQFDTAIIRAEAPVDAVFSELQELPTIRRRIADLV